MALALPSYPFHSCILGSVLFLTSCMFPRDRVPFSVPGFFSSTKHGDKLYICQVPFNSTILLYQRNLFHWRVKQRLNHFMVLQLLAANH